MTANVFIVLSVAIIFDGMQYVFQAPIRALGMQNKAAHLALACSYLVGIPLATFLAFW